MTSPAVLDWMVSQSHAWTAIYNSGGAVVGYGCHRSVTGGTTHVVSHNNPDGKLAVVVYGWNASDHESSYGYHAGLRVNLGIR